MTKKEIRTNLEKAKSLSEIFPKGATNDDLTRLGWLIYGSQEDTRLYHNYDDVPKSVRRIETESNAWSMMISVHTYGNVDTFFSDTASYNYRKYLQQYENDGGNRDTFMQSLEVQRNHLKNSTRIKNLGTDAEGNIYHGLKEPDTIIRNIVLPN